MSDLHAADPLPRERGDGGPARFAALLLLVAVGCAKVREHSALPALDALPAKDTAPTTVAVSANGYVPIFHVGTDSEEIKAVLAARFAEAHVDAQILSVSDFPESDVPAFVNSRTGWLVFVSPAQREAGKAVEDAWLESMRASAQERRLAAARESVTLGEEKPLAPETLASLQAEIQKRVKVDQAVRLDPARHGEMQKVDADNTAWLKKVVIEHGWIDVDRFGAKAANAAFLFVQHSGDFPLMNDALPKIERDVRAGRLSGGNFAMLFDRLQLMQGGKQRYGTQVMQDTEKGDWVVGRLEDPDRVDERRKEMGMGSLKVYLSRFGHPVRIER